MLLLSKHTIVFKKQLILIFRVTLRILSMPFNWFWQRFWPPSWIWNMLTIRKYHFNMHSVLLLSQHTIVINKPQLFLIFKVTLRILIGYLIDFGGHFEFGENQVFRPGYDFWHTSHVVPGVHISLEQLRYSLLN